MPSSVVADMVYNARKHTLRIIFVSGMVYDYKDVPTAVYLAMKSSESKGLYLNLHIKGHYAFRKVK